MTSSSSVSQSTANYSTSGKNLDSLFTHLAKGDKKACKELLQGLDININERDKNLSTPLIVAVQKNYLDVVSILLENPNVEVNTVDKNCYTALHWAAFKGYNKIILQLLKHPDLDINVLDAKKQQTPLHILVDNTFCQEVIAKLLEKPQLKVNTQDKKGRTALYKAVRNRKYNIVCLLLDHRDLDPNLPDKKGKTSLLYAAYNNFPKIVDRLAAHPRIDINQVNQKGQTALIVAVYHCYSRMFSSLLNAPHIDINVVDNYGFTAFYYALKFQRREEAKALIQKGDLIINSAEREKLMHMVVQTGDRDLVQMMSDLNIVQRHEANQEVIQERVPELASEQDLDYFERH